MPAEPEAGPESLNVQQACEQMMRKQVAPALRELGFKGTLRIFNYGSGSRRGSIRWQKDGRATRQQRLFFTINVGWAGDGGRVGELLPLPATDTWWELRGGQPTESVAHSVVSAIRIYALPAIQAGLDGPDGGQGPDVYSARTFPPVPRIAEQQPDGGSADDSVWYLQPAGTDADSLFAQLASEITHDRLDAAGCITVDALTDPRAVPALVDRLQRDSSPHVRREIASRMLTILARDPHVRAALQASAADDEDPQVRWAARYALRLDLEREPGRPALARWPRDGGISGCRPP
jgi:HEAT repeats